MYLSLDTSPFMRICPSPALTSTTARRVARRSSGSWTMANRAGSTPSLWHTARIAASSPTRVPSTRPSSTAWRTAPRVCESLAQAATRRFLGRDFTVSMIWSSLVIGMTAPRESRS